MEEILRQLIGSISHDLRGFSTIPGGAGFLPSTVVMFIGKMVGAQGDDNLNNQPHIHLMSRGYLLGISPFKGLLGGDRIQIHSLKLTANAPENRPS